MLTCTLLMTSSLPGKQSGMAGSYGQPHVQAGKQRGLNTGAGDWIKSVTQNLCAGYHEWAARVTLDYGR